MIKKSVISLIAYDAHMLVTSIKSYYNYVDEIILGLDKNRISWSGNKFVFDENKLWKELKNLDSANKIHVVEENFHQSKVAIENDNFQRNFLKSHCSNDWIFSFDADEVLVNPSEFFVHFLPLAERYYKNSELLFTWYLPYKRMEIKNAVTGNIDKTILMICNNDGNFFKGDTQGFACSKDSTYTYCRWTEKKAKILTNLAIMHWSFCRPEEEVAQKIANYGHSNKKNEDPFFETWKLIDAQNFTQLRNFKTSGFGQAQWEKLVPIEEKDLYELAKLQSELIL